MNRERHGHGASISVSGVPDGDDGGHVLLAQGTGLAWVDPGLRERLGWSLGAAIAALFGDADSDAVSALLNGAAEEADLHVRSSLAPLHVRASRGVPGVVALTLRFDPDDSWHDIRERYRLLVENTADVVVQTLQGVLLWVSPSIQALAGWTPDDLQGHTTTHLWHPDDLQTALQQRDATYSGEPSRGTLRLRTKDGDHVWVDVALKPYALGDGRRGAVGSLRDVSAQIEAQRRASTEHARLQAMFTSMVEPHLMLQAVRDHHDAITDFTIIDINPTAAQRFQRSVDDLRGLRFIPLLPPVMSDQVLELLSGWVERDKPVALTDWRLTDADGERYYDLRASVLDDLPVVAWREVTDSHEQAAELLASEAAYRVLSENAADLILRLDASDHIVWVSPSSRRLLGYLPEELLGNGRWDVIHPDDRADYRRTLHALRKRARNTVATEVRLQHRHGPFAWWSATARRTTDDPATSEIVIALSNIDAEKRARLRLQSEQAKRAAAVESMLDAHVLLRAVTDDDGSVTDFVYADANAAACEYMDLTHEQLIGASVMTLLPAHATSGLLDCYIHTLMTGEPLILDDFEYPHEVLGESRRFDIRGVKVGDSIFFTWRDVTDRYAMTERLEASERRYRLLAENSLDVIAEVSMDGVIQWMSPSVTRVLGWQPGELVGTRNVDLVHPDDRTRVRSELSRLMASHKPSRITMRVRHRDGGAVWMEAVGQSASPVGDQQPIRVVRLRDVEAEHREQERLRAAVDGVVDPLVLLSPVYDEQRRICDFVYQEVNAATCEYLSLSRDELIGNRLLTLMPNLAQAGLFDLYVQAFYANEPFTVDDVLYDNEVLGLQRRYDIRASSTDSQLVLTWRDVTVRHAQAQALADAEEQARVLAENATDVVFRIDARGFITFCSEGVRRLLGFSTGEVVGTAALDFVHPDDQRGLLGLNRHDKRIPPVRVRLRTHDGSYLWVEINARSILGADGEPAGVVGGWRDVSAEVNIQAQLRKQARTDALTGLLNRREAFHRLGGDAVPCTSYRTSRGRRLRRHRRAQGRQRLGGPRRR